MDEKYYAKYRGQVIDNKDPNGLGRLKVQVPSVLGDVTDSWAMPAAPYAGPQVGFFFLPPIGANVWVEFEGGDHTLPIWTGGYWTTKDDLPLSPAGPDTKVLRTEGIFLAHNNSADSVTVDDQTLDKGLTLYVHTPVLSEGYLKLFMGVDGLIEIDNNGKETITMNDTNIVVSKEDTATLTLTKSTIEAKTGGTDVKMESDPSKITITQGSASITLSQQGIDSTFGAGEVNMAQNSLAVSYGPGSITLGPSGITISYSGATVSLSPATVDVNNGALTVV